MRFGWRFCCVADQFEEPLAENLTFLLPVLHGFDILQQIIPAGLDWGWWDYFFF